MKRCITEDLTDSNPYSDSGNEDAKIYCTSIFFFFFFLFLKREE